MKKIENEKGLERAQIEGLLDDMLKDIEIPKYVLLVAPDITRFHSRSGEIACYIYDKLKTVCSVQLLVALGTHEGMTAKEAEKMYPTIPFDKIVNHNWRKDVVKLGVVPSEFVREVSDGLCDFDIDVEINKSIVSNQKPLVISIGQVVPHEVVGMANGNKNLFVGCGGSMMINYSHMLGAVCDMEKIMGRDFSAVRRVFDYAEKAFLKNVNLVYALSVINEGKFVGLYVGRERKTFEDAVAMSQRLNLIYLDKPLDKVIVNLDENEFRSTWLGNKSIYRTRLAIATGGELLVLAKGVEKFGEDEQIDKLIRKYGYSGRDEILAQAFTEKHLAENLSAAAHLIHGSSNGRFKITYAVKKLTKEEVEGVKFQYADYDEAYEKYNVEKLKNGWNEIDGERVFYIDNPAVGLWSSQKII